MSNGGLGPMNDTPVPLPSRRTRLFLPLALRCIYWLALPRDYWPHRVHRWAQGESMFPRIQVRIPIQKVPPLPMKNPFAVHCPTAGCASPKRASTDRHNESGLLDFVHGIAHTLLEFLLPCPAMCLPTVVPIIVAPTEVVSR